MAGLIYDMQGVGMPGLVGHILSAHVRRPAVEEDGENQKARYQRQQAAVSVLRLAIRNACGTRGVEYLEVDAANTTRVCHACGSVEQWNQAAELSHTCGSCGVLWDQDFNGADNILHDRGGAVAPTQVAV
ncbi:MAG: transposase [Proteobacteria bacterium]|nr:transposase [Pseudomonadota bacterium]